MIDSLTTAAGELETVLTFQNIVLKSFTRFVAAVVVVTIEDNGPASTTDSIPTLF